VASLVNCDALGAGIKRLHDLACAKLEFGGKDSLQYSDLMKNV
jgi:hypothetical protein